MSKRIDLVGKRFGMLIALEYVGDGKYKCLCDCGQTCVVFGSNLVRNHTKSCGCKKKVDLQGQRFGMLTVISRAERNEKYQYWICRCDCGKKCEARHDVLVRGGKTSCGCKNQNKDIPQKMRDDFVDGTQISKIQSTPTKANKSGIVGVNYDKARGKWAAGIRFRGKRYNLGRYNTLGEAAAAREAAEEAIFGDFLQWYEIATRTDKNGRA